MTSVIAQAPAQKRRSTYNPHAIRRVARRAENLPGNVRTFTVKSETRNAGPTHSISLDLQTASVFCSCESFYWKSNRAAVGGIPVDLRHAETHCKHLDRCCNALCRSGELSAVRDVHGNVLGYNVRHDRAPMFCDGQSDGYDFSINPREFTLECWADLADARRISEGEHAENFKAYREVFAA